MINRKSPFTYLLDVTGKFSKIQEAVQLHCKQNVPCFSEIIITSCRQVPATICCHPCPPSVGAEVPHATELNAPVDCRPQSSSTYQCCLTR